MIVVIKLKLVVESYYLKVTVPEKNTDYMTIQPPSTASQDIEQRKRLPKKTNSMAAGYDFPPAYSNLFVTCELAESKLLERKQIICVVKN